MSSFSGFSQSAKQKELEAKRKQYQKELKQINALLFSDRKKEKSLVSLVENLNTKISVRRNLIKITNDQANLLTREINANQNEISNLKDQLETLKANYAKMIVKSYKSKSEQSRVMFLLSSDNFKQAYKRLQYLNQYTDHQKEQGELIKDKTRKLETLNLDLQRQKKDKDKLVAENRIVKSELEAELKEQEELMASIRQNMSKYASQAKEKQKQIDQIDREIDRLIKEAIAASNKKAGNTSNNSGKFILTPEAKALAKNFQSNKGNLPWPLVKGIVKVKFGKQPSPIDRTVTIQSSGWRIATEKNASVRAVFKGEVLAVITQKKGNPAVLIQHGNYITAYKNLNKIFVSKGDTVTTGQSIGEVFTNGNGETLLWFSLYDQSTPINPASWLKKL